MKSLIEEHSDWLQEQPLNDLSPYAFVMEAILNQKVPDLGFVVIPAGWGVAS